MIHNELLWNVNTKYLNSYICIFLDTELFQIEKYPNVRNDKTSRKFAILYVNVTSVYKCVAVIK